MQQKTSEAKREAKRAVRRAQNEEWIKLGRSLQDDFQRNQRRFWRRVTKKSERKEAGKVCDENGEVIDEEERVLDWVLDCWKDYFGGLLDGGVQSEEECSRQDTESWLEEGIDIEEVIAAIAKLKNGKAPGICGISAEMLKAGRSAVAK